MQAEQPSPIVLIVDDEFFATSRYGEALSAIGFQVRVAASVPEAVDRLAKCPFDLVVLDVMMEPDGVFDEKKVAGGYRTGIALAELIQRRWPRTRIVALTASNEESPQEWFRHAGIPFFHKTVIPPFEFAQRMWEASGLSSAMGAAGTNKAERREGTKPPGDATVRSARIRPRKPGASSGEVPDVLILTAADVEYETVIELAGIGPTLSSRRRTAGARTFIDLGLRGYTVWAFQCKKGSVGPGSSLDVLKDALHELSPKPVAVVCAGIAFGLQQAKQAMGDILIAEQIRLFEVERRAQVRLARGDKVSCSPLLFSWFRDFLVDWAEATPGRVRPHVHSGLLMSGEKLADDEAFVTELHRIEPEAIGGEMEAAGVYTAATGEYQRHVQWLVVKAICDWGAGKGDKYQVIAARNAVDLILHVLEQPTVLKAVTSLRGPRGRHGPRKLSGR